MEELYIGTLQFPYTEFSNFKEKEALNILSIIGGTRVRDFISFTGYSNISFDDDDTKHWKPKAKQLESFVRNKSNALVFNIHNCLYDKMYVYKSNLKDSGFYGLIFYNTENQKSLNIFNIEYNYSKLIISINRILSNKKVA